MSSIRLTPHARRPDGSRKLVAALEAPGHDPHILEVVTVRPADELDTHWLLDGDTRVNRRLTAAIRDVAQAHAGTVYRLDRLLYAVLAPAGMTPGTVAIAARAAVASTSEALADCVFHGTVSVPDEDTGTQALALALARLQARARPSARSAMCCCACSPSAAAAPRGASPSWRSGWDASSGWRWASLTCSCALPSCRTWARCSSPMPSSPSRRR
jgi:hypothetical protein